MRGVRSARFGTGFARCTAAETAPGTADLQARGKPFEIALLLVGEVDGESFNFHILRRSSCCHRRGSTGKRILTARKSIDFQRAVRPASLLRKSIFERQQASMAAGCTA